MSDQMKREFEQWMRDVASKHVMADTVEVDGNYVFPETRLLWQAWQASRKALVVELPSEKDGYAQQFSCYSVDHILDALDAAGVTYK